MSVVCSSLILLSKKSVLSIVFDRLSSVYYAFELIHISD